METKATKPMLTQKQMNILIVQTNKYRSMSDDDLMKLVTQYAIKNTAAISENRAMLVEAAMRLNHA
jgi:hypothetical protein